MLNIKSIKSTYGAMQGAKVATAPKGFSKDDPAIDLLRYKQYWFERSFTDKEVLSKDFLNEIKHSFKNIRPFFDYASEVLITAFKWRENSLVIVSWQTEKFYQLSG